MDDNVVLLNGDCLDVLQTLEAESVDSIVTDPPYGLSFMGKDWDHGVPGEHFWREAIRVAKPGAHLLAFGGTRMFHRLAVAIEDAGWEIRDTVMWVYGSGFPKSHDVSKAITNRADSDKVREIKMWLAEQFAQSGKSKALINRECGFTASDYLKTEAGNDAGGRATWHTLLPYGEKWERLKAVVGFGSTYDAEIKQYGNVVGQRRKPKENREIYGKYSGTITDYDLTEAAKQWQGWGTALKPAWEPIIVARKPLIGTVADNVLKHGTGAMNIDGCRVGEGEVVPGGGNGKASNGASWGGGNNGDEIRAKVQPHAQGRWPANLIHDGSDEVVGVFPATTTNAGVGVYGDFANKSCYGDGWTRKVKQQANSGSAARFFYCAKASKRDRNEGLPEGTTSSHPTVKPTDLMRYLCRLVTPPGGTVLDPFMGSGSTGKAAILEGFNFIGIEREAEYLEIARARIEHVDNTNSLAGFLED